MKKAFAFFIIMILSAGLLYGCHIFYPESESDFYFEKTVELLSAGNLDAAEDLNCTLSGSTTEAELQTAYQYLFGRTMIDYEKTSSEITNHHGSYGVVTEEDAIYEMTLDDGSVFIIHTFYSHGYGVKGFVTFAIQDANK